MSGTIKTVVLTALFLISFERVAQGEPCADKMLACSRMVSDQTRDVSMIMYTKSPNMDNIVSKCQQFDQALKACEQEAYTVCPATSSINETLKGLHTTYDSICGTEAMCNAKSSGCTMDLSAISQITDALSEKPPNVQAHKEACSQLMSKLSPCLAELKAECSQVTSLAVTISSKEEALDGVCGKQAMCQAQLGKCQYEFTTLATSDLPDSEKFQQMCRIQKDARSCMATELDADCHKLPELQSSFESLDNSLSLFMCEDGDGGPPSNQGPSYGPEGCPQVFECLSNMKDISGQNCSAMGKMMSCFSDLRDTCQVKEDLVTFTEMQAQAERLCQDLTGTNMDCAKMGQCVTSSDLVRTMSSVGMSRPSAQLLKTMTSKMLDSATWCQYLEISSRCFVFSADSCQYDEDKAKSVSKLNTDLRASCNISSSGVKTACNSSALFLVLAMLTLWMRGSL